MIIVTLSFKMQQFVFIKLWFTIKIIRDIINLFDENIIYHAQKGISQNQYSKANFRSSYRGYISEDYMSGKMEEKYDFQLSRVILYNHFDGNNIAIFDGFIALVEVPKLFNTFVYLREHVIMYCKNHI